MVTAGGTSQEWTKWLQLLTRHGNRNAYEAFLCFWTTSGRAFVILGWIESMRHNRLCWLHKMYMIAPPIDSSHLNKWVCLHLLVRTSWRCKCCWRLPVRLNLRPRRVYTKLKCSAYSQGNSNTPHDSLIHVCQNKWNWVASQQAKLRHYRGDTKIWIIQCAHWSLRCSLFTWFSAKNTL